MPIHDLGYRSWQGKKTSHLTRWCVIAISGIRVAWRNQWLRRTLVVAWLPAVYVGMGFFAYEQYLEEGQNAFAPQIIAQLFQSVPDIETISAAIEEDAAGSRHLVWAWLLMIFFRYPQAILMLLVVGMVAPPLIAKDVRSRGFLLYFSRPISPREYLLGKATIVWCYLTLMTTLPALALYVLAVGLSPSLWIALETWDLPLRILVASLVVSLPTTSLALMFSSLTSESRFAGFAWFTIWALGWVAYLTVSLTHEDPDERWTMISLYHTLGNVQRWIFGIDMQANDVWHSMMILGGLTLFSVLVLMRRVSAPIRV